jgi:hypothetical protein
MDTETRDLAGLLGINAEQIKSWKGNARVSFPDYWNELKSEVHKHILEVLSCKDTKDNYWKLDGKALQLLLDSYSIIPSYQKVARQLGNCHYGKKRIRLNFGNQAFTKRQCRRTLIHEYVHAITYTFYSYSGHGELFQFYNNVLQMAFKKTYRQRSHDEIQERLNAKT